MDLAVHSRSTAVRYSTMTLSTGVMGRYPFHSISAQADVVQKNRMVGNGVGGQLYWLGLSWGWNKRLKQQRLKCMSL